MARILLVEDERVVAWNIQEILQIFEHEVVANIASAEDAIRIAGDARPNLVLMDIRLRGAMDGIAAAKQIWEEFNIPVVYLTAHADDQTLHQALVTAPFGYLLKPFSRLELQVTIETALRRYQVERELVMTRQWLKTTLISIGDATIATDRTGRITFMNPVAEEMTGWQFNEALGKPTSQVLQLIDGDTQEAIVNPLLEAINTGKRTYLSSNSILQLRDGSRRFVGDSASPITDDNGNIIGGVLVLQDMTERKQVEDLLRQQAERERLMSEMTQRIRRSLNTTDTLQATVAEIRQLFQADRVLIYQFNSEGKGMVIAESVGLGWRSLLGKVIVDDCIRLDSCIQAYLQGHIQNTADVQTAPLEPCYVELLTQLQVRANLVVPLVQDDQVWGLIAVQQCSSPRHWQASQIDLLKQLSTQVAIAIQQSELYQKLQVANQELQRLAMVDGLTQVANRRYFDDYFHQEWQRLNREQRAISLMLCDIDYFKNYNDRYGHQAGDVCLQKIAQAIEQTVQRPADLVSRYGGEEFAIVLPNTDGEGAVYIAKQIQGAIAQLELPHTASLVSQYVTVSLGIASIIPSMQQNPEDLIEAADRALYTAKTNGRNLYHLTPMQN